MSSRITSLFLEAQVDGVSATAIADAQRVAEQNHKQLVHALQLAHTPESHSRLGTGEP